MACPGVSLPGELPWSVSAPSWSRGSDQKVSSIEAAQGRLGVPVTGVWDSTTDGAAVAYQAGGEGFLPMEPSAHIDPPTLINLGYYDPLAELPSEQRAYVEGGARPGTVLRDLGTAVNQVPRWAWGVSCIAFYLLAYSAYYGSRKKPYKDY